MELDNTDYVLNRNIIRAVERDNLSYLIGISNLHPWLIDALLYSEQKWSGVGLLEFTSKQPIICLATPFAYSLIAGKSKVMHGLLKKLNVNPYESCQLIEAIQDPIGLGTSYKVLELPPICLIQPGDTGFSNLCEIDMYSTNRAITVRSKLYCGSDVRASSMSYSSYWDYCIGISRRLHNAQNLIDFVQLLLRNGYDCHDLLKQADVLKLFTHHFHLSPTKGFRSMEHIVRANHFLRLILDHGACLNDNQVMANLTRGLLEVVAGAVQMPGALEAVSKSLYSMLSLSWDLSYIRENIRLPLVLSASDSIEKEGYHSLLQQCLRLVRYHIGTKFFQRHVKQLRCSNELKQMIVTGYK